VRLHFCGVRGSTPAPGLPFARYGGHTSSVAIAHDGAVPTLVLDAGTGIRRVPELLDGPAYEGSLLLTHLHWDHVHGLPFFKAGFAPGARVDVALPAIDGDAAGTLARGMSPPHFPVGPEQMGPGWSYRGLDEGTMEVEGFTVTVREIPHKGGPTFGFRVSDGQATIAYLPDHAPLFLGDGDDGLGVLHPAAIELASGVDVLLHDSQFVAAEFPAVAFLGHASVEYSVSLAVTAGASRLGLFHHSPDRTDEQIDVILDNAQRLAAVDVFAATEGASVTLTSSAPSRSR